MDWYVAVTQREAGGGSGGDGRPGEMNGVLVESVKNSVGGSAVAHVHDPERRLHTGRDQRSLLRRRAGAHTTLTVFVDLFKSLL